MDGDAATPPPPAEEVTALLAAVREGDAAAGDRLFHLVYADLKRIARRQLGGGGGVTLTPTALVHEAYLRLARPGSLEQNDRTHFFAVAARAMRQILVDAARRRNADKRGGGALAVELAEERVGGDARIEEMLALDTALERLEGLDPRLAQVVEWRFFGGSSLEEIADVLGVSERTLKRDWRRARAFLYGELARGGGPEGPPASAS